MSIWEVAVNEKVIESGLDAAKRDLASLEERRQALIGLIQNYETLLRLERNGSKNGASTPPGTQRTLIPAVRRQSTPKGTISLSAAIRQVLADAQGAGLRSDEILARALRLGAKTEAKNPRGAIELVCSALVKSGRAVKIGPRTYKAVN